MSISITAVITSRNEYIYLKNLLPYLAQENIEVVLIDNDSDDGTKDEFRPQNYPNIIERRDLPYEGSFDLSAQLAAKAQVFQSTKSDWLIHQDSDEILHSPTGWGMLRSSIEEANAEGFNVLNFNELVMLPFDIAAEDYLNNNRNFYFFEPRPLRLMRAWRKDSNLSNQQSGGHMLTGGDVRVSPKRMLLKHFMVRSQKHAIEKYCGRTFSDTDLKKGWHTRRLGLTPEMLQLPRIGGDLHTLETPQSVPKEFPKPVNLHYWHW